MGNLLSAPDSKRTNIGNHLSAPEPTPSDMITIHAGGQKLAIRRSILECSPVLRNILATNPGQRNLTYPRSTDTDTWKHVLQYLEQQSTYPLFWTKEAGFDYALYHRVEREAESLQVWDLRDWVKEQKYLGAIKTITEETIEEIQPGQPVRLTEHIGDGEVQQHILKKVRYFHVCPRGTAAHRTERGKPILCGRKCTNRLDYDPGRLEEEPYVEVVTVTEKVLFDAEVCGRKVDVAGAGGESENTEETTMDQSKL